MVELQQRRVCDKRGYPVYFYSNLTLKSRHRLSTGFLPYRSHETITRGKGGGVLNNNFSARSPKILSTEGGAQQATLSPKIWRPVAEREEEVIHQGH